MSENPTKKRGNITRKVQFRENVNVQPFSFAHEPTAIREVFEREKVPLSGKIRSKLVVNSSGRRRTIRLVKPLLKSNMRYNLYRLLHGPTFKKLKGTKHRRRLTRGNTTKSGIPYSHIRGIQNYKKAYPNLPITAQKIPKETNTQRNKRRANAQNNALGMAQFISEIEPVVLTEENLNEDNNNENNNNNNGNNNNRTNNNNHNGNENNNA